MSVVVCTNLAECKEKLETRLNELEREAEFVAGILESVDEKAASFEELKKVLGGELTDAFYKSKVDSVEIFVQPNPVVVKEELSRRAEEMAKMIEIYRQLVEIMNKVIEVWGEGAAEVVVSITTQGAKVFITVQ